MFRGCSQLCCVHFFAEHGHRKSLTVIRRQAAFLFVLKFKIHLLSELLNFGDGLVDLTLPQPQGLRNVQGLQVPLQEFLEDRAILRLD